MKLTLSRADAGTLQDAWHYAMMLIDRGESTFDGSYDYPRGIRGQMVAYDNLLGVIDKMSADDETWELVRTEWWCAPTFEAIIAAAREALDSINAAAIRLGIDARTGE